ncbi:vitamin B12-dependent ribonucleotide reductase [Xanthovirga aplysinae]|uniref:vitamin B12-dependent ribonucleotide reductase n=1 Tax=Xanthovirga aplysinae TaxID=2529853 RepID=UPI0012BCB0A9|nr:vitamin B12-dependent ribonucleotide reductase [Xanthovirga aplysinae]MTI32174.1 vitamin B12-dependent ribonucleotide reductase [Xanthovirga aplysinae]
MKTSTRSQKSSKGLSFYRFNTKEGISPFNQFSYKRIKTEGFEIEEKTDNRPTEVEVPATWSSLATQILVEKYFRKSGVPYEEEKFVGENSVKQLVHRLAHCWKEWGEKYGYFASSNDANVFYDELVFSMLAQQGAPNSPQWFNTGLFSSYGLKGKPQGHYYVDPHTEEIKPSSSAYERPQVHACFILPVKDELVNEGGIMDLWLKEARIFKYGSGVGTNFSKIRAKNEELSCGGYSSGLMSFLEVGDKAAGVIKSGGTTRRAAKMVVVDLDHPEIEDFILWKAREEKKAETLIMAGYSEGFEGEAYQTVSGQNSNNSVRIPDDFFKVLKEKGVWKLRARTSGQVVKEIPAEQLWDSIASAAWSSGDPGVQFDTTINNWHTCPKGGRINASNPCSEYMFLDNSACNLASINLVKFWDQEKQEFNTEAFEYACRLWTVVLEISVLMAQFPSKEIAKLSYEYRTLGLGYANLGGLLMRSAIPYDSERGRAWASGISSLMTGIAYSTSAELASLFSPFKKYEENKKDMLQVLHNHQVAIDSSVNNFEGLKKKPPTISFSNCPKNILNAARLQWKKALELGNHFGFRNAQVSVIAPTGTIGLLMDCDTTGIEPDYALMKFKSLVGGDKVKIVNQAVEDALKTLGYNPEQIKSILDHISKTMTIEGAPHLNEKDLPIFDCANRCGPTGKRFLNPLSHVKMMAAVQPFISGAISKTVNLPQEASKEEIKKVYFEAWKLGLKACAIYRDKSKLSQPLSGEMIFSEAACSAGMCGSMLTISATE